MEKFHLGLIGCGAMANTYSRQFHNLKSRAQMVVTADIDEGRAKRVAEKFEAKKAVTDYREMLDDVDGVIIALPHHLHYEVAKECLEAGKHVLLEKPMANTEKECLDLMEIAKKADRVLMLAYCMRYHPLVTKMKELLDEKVYGDVFQVSVWTEQHTEYPPEHWASKASQLGGGQLFSHGCHYIDILLWYLGRPIKGTHVGTNYGTPWMEREGTSNVAIEFEGGKLGYHFGTWGARGSRLRYSFHAHCTEGMIEAAISHGKLIAHANGEEKLLIEIEPGKHTHKEVEHFLDCVETGQTPFTNVTEALQGLRVIWRLYQAEEENLVADLRGLGLDEFDKKPMFK